MTFQLEQSIGFTLNRTALKVRAEMSRRLRPFDLTPEQWSVLHRLAGADGITQKELSDRTFKDTPGTARILDKLVERGLVVRTSHPEDRRAFLIFITDRGREVWQRILPVAVLMNDDAGSGLSAAERVQLLQLLNRVQGALEGKAAAGREQ